MDFGYARVSVREPESRNLNLQIEQLVRVGISLDSIYSEEASGANRDRAELLKLLAVMETGDVLVVTHLDRLSRNLTHGLGVIESLHERGVNFRSLNEEMDTTDSQRQAATGNGTRVFPMVQGQHQGALDCRSTEGQGPGAASREANGGCRRSRWLYARRSVQRGCRSKRLRGLLE